MRSLNVEVQRSFRAMINVVWRFELKYFSRAAIELLGDPIALRLSRRLHASSLR